ncbi:hypothetical protein [Sporichthya sp.]|uniref:hypothetical protein n=1 Tax=Sporichthya sp. TaxID=65475 RepID=UPI0017C23291|nr:hypothetical protein [Sporichthya sp.]MBA3742157.1 hypothetical protein [Sporichthya sp.]
MHRSAVTPLLAGALILPLAAPAQAAESEPVGNVNIVIAGVAFGQFTYPLEAGKRITIQRHVLDPGEIISWNGPSTVVAMHGNEDGDLTNFPNCRSQQTWRPYPAYYVARSKEAGTLTGVTANRSSVPIEFYTVKSEAIGVPQSDGQLHREPTSPQAGDVIAGEEPNPGGVGDPVTVANGCPAGAEGETTQLASGVMGASKGIDLTDHTQIVVYRHKLAAGYSSGWHSPNWPTVIVPISGEITTQHGCTDVTPQPVGEADVATGPILVKSKGAAEYLSVVWNIQNAFPVDAPFNLPEMPPAGCPESALPL